YKLQTWYSSCSLRFTIITISLDIHIFSNSISPDIMSCILIFGLHLVYKFPRLFFGFYWLCLTYKKRFFYCEFIYTIFMECSICFHKFTPISLFISTYYLLLNIFYNYYFTLYLYNFATLSIRLIYSIWS